MIAVSACLAGYPCAYDGKARTDPRVVALVNSGKAMPICPEQLGGLATPRDPAEILHAEAGHPIRTRAGLDLTDNFIQGAELGVKVCLAIGTSLAILKSRSPSCGTNGVYDGSFSHTIVEGKGLFAERLEEAGVTAYSEQNAPFETLLH